MPHMDGYQATAAIRPWKARAAGRRSSPFTANAQPEDRQRCLDAGMDDYLSKPIRREPLVAALSRWLPLKARPRRPCRRPDSPPPRPIPRRRGAGRWVARRTLSLIDRQA